MIQELKSKFLHLVSSQGGVSTDSDYRDLASFLNRRAQQPAAGLHALLIGVSRYPYLSGGDRTPAEQLQLYSKLMKQLSGPAKTAADLTAWLTSRDDRMTAPLRTCRLLVSPTQSEPGELNRLDDATHENVKKAILDWQTDLASDGDNIGIFFFAGHGVQKDKYTPILLPSDFLGGDKPLDRAFDALEIYKGMDRSNKFPKMALTQLYFFDACQTHIPGLIRDTENIPQIFDTIEIHGTSSRIAPIFYSSAPGHAALNKKGVGTHFGIDLLACLRNDGADYLEGSYHLKRGRVPFWGVTVRSLSNALETLTDEVVDRAGMPIRTYTYDKNILSRTLIRVLDQTPSVRCTFRFDPDKLRRTAAITLNGRNGLAAQHPFPRPVRNPYKVQLTAGFYDLVTQELPPAYLPPIVDSLKIYPPMVDRTLQFRKIS